MDKIAAWLKAYIDAHPFDPGDSDCETVLDQLYQAYAESHESDPPEIGRDSKNWRTSFVHCLWMITTQYSTSAAASAPPMNIRPSSMVCYMVRT